ncbi:MAG TPA: transporter [Gemmatimonadales bacterium]|nr:transporter [Gemmatimonadales bacterium]
MSPARGLVAVSALLSFSAASLEGQIQDNSFLLEEAYNQESGVVQHINTFSISSGQDWGYAFSQEWPLGGIRHQLSYTVPIQRSADGGTGFGDIALNYRYQLAGHPEAGFVAAPRLSLLLPTGKEELGRGAGGLGLQANIPFSLVLSKALVTHWNAGLTLTPAARNSLGREATTTGFNLGASAVWLLRPSFNLLVETLWLSEEIVLGEGATQRDEMAVLSPGFRAAFDLAGGLQVVPGLAYTFYLTPDQAEDEAFVYLSFEHPFKRQ